MVCRGVYCRFYRADAAFAPNPSWAVRPRDVMVNVYNVNQVQIQLNLQLVFSLVL